MKYKIEELVIDNLSAENDIKKKIEEILQEMCEAPISKDVIAYILGGGFGRGEGSVEKNGECYETTNDYDIFAICIDSIEKSKIHELERNIEVKLNLQYFGIDVISISLFDELIHSKELSQSYFDFLKGSKMLWSNDKYSDMDLDKKIGFMNANISNILIPLSSAFDVLKTRMWCIVALADYRQGKLYDDTYVKDFNFFYYQQVKLATAIIDAVVIADGNYNSPKFSDKINWFKNSEFTKMYDTKLVSELVEDKIYNRDKIFIDRAVLLKLYSLYCNCVGYVIEKDLSYYQSYKQKEFIKAIYYRYIKKEKVSTWQLKDYKKIKLNNTKKLIQLQRKMRGMYR